MDTNVLKFGSGYRLTHSCPFHAVNGRIAHLSQEVGAAAQVELNEGHERPNTKETRYRCFQMYEFRRVTAA